MPKAHARANRRKWDRLILLTRRGFTWKMAGVLMSGTMTGIVLDGVKIANKHTSHLHFHLKAPIVDTVPSNFGPEGIGDGNFYDWIPDAEA